MYSYLKNDVAAVRQMERFEKARIERVTSEVKAQRRDHLALPSLGVRDLGVEAVRFSEAVAQLGEAAVQLSKAAWWVPAGIAVSIMLYNILGG